MLEFEVTPENRIYRNAIAVDVLEVQLASAKFALKVAEYELAQARAALVQVEGDDADATRLVEIRSPVTGSVLNVFEENARVVAQVTLSWRWAIHRIWRRR